VGTNPAETWKEAQKSEREIAVFGGGCFWCTERDFRVIPGVTATSVGYMGGHKKNPTYKEVCFTDTGHVEVTLVEWDPEVLTYEDLSKAFFKMHDPTQVNRQGPDIGTQYRSVIFTFNKEQEETAKKIRAVTGITLKRAVATKIEKAKKYWVAEGYHQQYYEKMGIIGKYGGSN
jgi:methionine-S-sulfoxide reductase